MKKTRLTEGWKVYRDKDAFSLVYALPEDAPEVRLPYDAMWHEEQRKEAVSAGRTSYLDGGVYHYYKELFFPASARGEKILLRFHPISATSRPPRNDYSPVFLSGEDAARVLRKMEASTGQDPGAFDDALGASVECPVLQRR